MICHGAVDISLLDCILECVRVCVRAWCAGVHSYLGPVGTHGVMMFSVGIWMCVELCVEACMQACV